MQTLLHVIWHIYADVILKIDSLLSRPHTELHVNKGRLYTVSYVNKGRLYTVSYAYKVAVLQYMVFIVFLCQMAMYINVNQIKCKT